MRSHVVITGGGSGLGVVIADELASRGRPVILVDRDEAAAVAAAGRLEARHRRPVPVVVADLATPAGVEAAGAALERREDVGGLVNNAGGWQPGRQYPAAPADAWQRALTLNLVAPMRLTQLLWNAVAHGTGAVVNVGSSAGEGDEPYASPEYGAAKAALRRFTSSLGDRGDDVRVMAVVPGWIGLPRALDEFASLTPAQQHRAGPLIPPREIATQVARLIDDGRPGEVVELLE
ncbi:SDR family NAD(P)-dependent oxidoreductase [Agromyces sp. NPDC057865]|uniref:SDR family NAD(P)-dependent oxidoreductase n=1 Tax=Agromyces sp. NPDC057865 TaxID=3346267 RepID=UPI00366E1176